MFKFTEYSLTKVEEAYLPLIFRFRISKNVVCWTLNSTHSLATMSHCFISPLKFNAAGIF